MFVPESLRLNKFQQVNIPTNQEYFSRMGHKELPEESYSGEEMADLGMSKVDEIDAYQKYAERMQKEANSKKTEDNA